MFLLSMMVVAYGKGEVRVVSTTDLCTLSLIATITWGSVYVCRYRWKTQVAEMCLKKQISTV